MDTTPAPPNPDAVTEASQPSVDTDPTEPMIGAATPPAGARARGISRSSWTLVLAMGVTVAAMMIAAEAGTLLSTFGWASGALAIAIVLMVAGILVWRQAMLPIALVAGALAVPAAVTAHTQPPIDASRGTLTVRPASLAALDGKHLRRGVGTVFLDLRETKFTAGQRVTVTARSDTGHVVVALPRTACVNLQITAVRAPSLRTASRAALLLASRRDPNADALAHFGLDRSAVLAAPDALPTTLVDPVLVAFGRGVGQGDRATYRRVSNDPQAPTLDIAIASPQTAVVRDYPKYIGPLEGGGREYAPRDQVGSINWPAEVRLPVPPGDLLWSDRWLGRWTKDQTARNVPARWAAWERDTIRAQGQQARRAAGACANRADLEATWSTVGFGEQPTVDEFGNPLLESTEYDTNGNPIANATSTTRYLLSVNGAGAVRRLAFGADGVLRPSTMTAANPKGATR